MGKFFACGCFVCRGEGIGRVALWHRLWKKRKTCRVFLWSCDAKQGLEEKTSFNNSRTCELFSLDVSMCKM